MRRFLVPMMACLLLLAPASANAAAWLTPTTVVGPAGDTVPVAAATDVAGDSWIFWRGVDSLTSNHVIFVSHRSPGGTWGNPREISDRQEDSADEIRAEATPQGDVVVVWNSDNGNNIAVRSRSMAAGSDWGQVRQVTGIDDTSDNANTLDLAVSPSGHTALSWRFSDSSGENWGTVGSISSDWEPPKRLETGHDDYLFPSTVAVDDTGNALFAWQFGKAAKARVHMMEKPSGAAWGSVFSVTVDVAGAHAEGPALAMDPTTGAALLAWKQFDGGERILFATRTLGSGWADGSWTSPQTPGLASDPDTTTGVSFPRVVQRPDGTQAIVWVAQKGADHVVQAAVRSPGQTKLTPFDVSGTLAHDQVLGRLALGSGGDVFAIWDDQTAAGQPTQAARLAPGAASFDPALEAIGRDGLETGSQPPLIGADGAGDAAAVTGSLRCATDACSASQFEVRSATFDGAPPHDAAITVPATGTVGLPLTMTASAADLWSAFAVSWAFGDGNTATGPSVTHAYAAPGVDTVTATFTDGVGNATTQSAPVTVAPAATPTPSPTPTPRKPKLTGSSKLKAHTLTVANVPTGATVTMRCTPRAKCSFKTKHLKVKKGKAVGKRLRFKKGAKLTVTIAKKGFATRRLTYTFKTANRLPKPKVG